MEIDGSIGSPIDKRFVAMSNSSSSSTWLAFATAFVNTALVDSAAVATATTGNSAAMEEPISFDAAILQDSSRSSYHQYSGSSNHHNYASTNPILSTLLMIPFGVYFSMVFIIFTVECYHFLVVWQQVSVAAQQQRHRQQGTNNNSEDDETYAKEEKRIVRAFILTQLEIFSLETTTTTKSAGEKDLSTSGTAFSEELGAIHQHPPSSCPICYCDMKDADRVAYIRTCHCHHKHLFHSHCLLQWLVDEKKPTCPYCRFNLLAPAPPPPAMDTDNNHNSTTNTIPYATGTADDNNATTTTTDTDTDHPWNWNLAEKLEMASLQLEHYVFHALCGVAQWGTSIFRRDDDSTSSSPNMPSSSSSSHR